MELNALTRWESIGKDLYAKGQLGQEIERIKHFSHLLAAARKQHRQAKKQRRSEGEDEPEEKTPYSVHVDASDPPAQLSGIAEEREPVDEEQSLAVDVTEDDGGHRAFSATSSLPLLYPEASSREEERIQDELEKKELDEIPVQHARVSSSASPHCRPPLLMHVLAHLLLSSCPVCGSVLVLGVPRVSSLHEGLRCGLRG